MSWEKEMKLKKKINRRIGYLKRQIRLKVKTAQSIQKKICINRIRDKRGDTVTANNTSQKLTGM